jgi:hypothetical protein
MPVTSTQQERAIIAGMRCSSCGGRPKLAFEHYLNTSNKRYYDWGRGACRKCGSRVEILFDITDYFRPGSMKVAIVICFVLAIGSLGIMGYELSHRGRNVLPAAIGVVVFGAFGAFGVYRLRGLKTRSHAVPEGAGDGRAAGDRDSEMARTLQQLGIPLDVGTTDAQTALLGGIAKAGIFNGVGRLQKGEFDAAISAFDSVLGGLESADSERWKAVRAAAYFLKGEACRGKGSAGEARSHYEAALKQLPGYAPAAEAIKRT